MNDSQESLKFFKVILSSIADGVFTVDKNRIITSFNPAAERITGIPASKAVGRQCSDVFHSDICERCLLNQTMQTGVEAIDRPVSIINNQGEKIPISIS
ncbi:MAG: PAS domain-containing protein, partial [bacterium]